MFSPVDEKVEMDALLEMCKGSKLVVNDGKYRGMRLLMPGDTKPIHTRVIVSAMHKLMRQKRSGELVYLLGCFFVAVWNDPGDAQVAQMKSKITCVCNRFAVCVFEEGCMLLINERAQRAVVRVFVCVMCLFCIFWHVGLICRNFFQPAGIGADYDAEGARCLQLACCYQAHPAHCLYPAPRSAWTHHQPSEKPRPAAQCVHQQVGAQGVQTHAQGA